MVIETNPLKWFRRVPVVVPAAVVSAAAQVDVPAKAVEMVMSTVAPVVQVAGAVKPKTWLQKAGTFLANLLHIGVELAEVAEPLVDVAVPQVASLYNGTVGFFVQSEASFGAAPGTGAAKLSASLPAITANLKAWADANGFEVIDADVSKWASAFADTLNLLPVVKKS